MTDYRRDRTPGGTWFFTLVTLDRRCLLTLPLVRRALRQAIEITRSTHPFTIDAWVLLPDHLHCLWTLPPGDAGFSVRWSQIKRRTSQLLASFPGLLPPPGPGRLQRREVALWQRRFWEHRIRNAEDLRRHFDYVHWNPVKHGYVARVMDWPWSSFHRCVRQGLLSQNWGGGYSEPGSAGFGE